MIHIDDLLTVGNEEELELFFNQEKKEDDAKHKNIGQTSISARWKS